VISDAFVKNLRIVLNYLSKVAQVFSLGDIETSHPTNSTSLDSVLANFTVVFVQRFSFRLVFKMPSN
jgi:hypothetical protein